MQATTYKRSVFAYSGDNFYTHTHKAGHVFKPAPSPRSEPVRRFDASGRLLTVAVAHVTTEPSESRAKDTRTWEDCECGRQRPTDQKFKRCQHGAGLTVRQAGVEVW